VNETSSPIRVVIVDDERLFAELMRVALRGADGINVEAVVHNVKTAIAALNEHKPDVVLADYHLPDGTGADLARAVRNTLPDTAVLVLTSRDPARWDTSPRNGDSRRSSRAFAQRHRERSSSRQASFSGCSSRAARTRR